MKKVTIMDSTLEASKKVMRLFVRTLNALLVVLIEIIKLMGHAMLGLFEWFNNTVAKVLETAYGR